MLDHRFKVIRNVMALEIEKLVNLPNLVEKQNVGATLRKIYDEFVTTEINCKQIIERNFTVANDIKLDAKMYRIIRYCLISRCLDNNTKTGFLTKINVEPSEIPDADTLLAFIDTKAINYEHTTQMTSHKQKSCSAVQSTSNSDATEAKTGKSEKKSKKD